MRRILLVENDPNGRALARRALAASGLAVTAVASVNEVLPSCTFDAAVVDELAGAGKPLAELAAARERQPTLPVVLTGTLLSSEVLMAAIEVGISAALPKPFSPAELRRAVERALERGAPEYGSSLEYAAAVAHARSAIASGRAEEARPFLSRAHALAPLDAEPMALEALLAELQGKDELADRGFRAALALRHEEDAPAPHPMEGLARLAAYGGATPVERLPRPFRGAEAWVVADAAGFATIPSPREGEKLVVLAPLCLTGGPGSLYLRAAAERAFALLTGSLRADEIARALDVLDLARVRASVETAVALDLDQVQRRRRATPPSPATP